MEIWIDRDSVSAGDDETAHRRTVEVADDATLAEVLSYVGGIGFLPDRADELTGRQAWWVVADVAVAVVSSRASGVWFLARPDTPSPAGLFFRHVPESRHIRVTLTRDSVAAGDDVHAPHRREQLMASDATLGQIVHVALGGGYLAPISGGRATWVVVAGSTPCAVVAQQWTAPRWLADPDMPVPPALHFRYESQRDPEAVLTESRGA